MGHEYFEKMKQAQNNITIKVKMVHLNLSPMKDFISDISQESAYTCKL